MNAAARALVTADVDPDRGEPRSVESKGDVEDVLIASLDVGGWLRRRRSLGEPIRWNRGTDPSTWLPIVVSRRSGKVIDGHRRLRAARSRGWTHISVRWFDGDEEAELLEFLRLNDTEDRALDRSELRGAAAWFLRWHPDWSDRRVAALCSVPPKVVADVRAELGAIEPALGAAGAGTRVGRDGRVRPIDWQAQRVCIAEAVKEQPGASLRAIAGPLGVSPETVRRVRAELTAQGLLARDTPIETELLAFSYRPPSEPTWLPDQAFTSRDDAADVAAFLERTDTSMMDPERSTAAIPISRIYEVADEARRRAAFWQRFADAAERRTRATRS
jgi:hypothetical protein